MTALASKQLQHLYTDLNPLEQEFRLVRIAAFDPQTQEMLLILWTATLQQPPNYFALSYEWDRPTQYDSDRRTEVCGTPVPIKSRKGESVSVDGTPVTLGSKLEEFLFTLATDGMLYVPLWIDAICSHQTNLIEQGHQVGLMEDIYRKATHVFLWVGTSNAHTHSALDFIQRCALNHEKEPAVVAIKNALVDPGMIDTLLAIRDLLTRTCWERVWIVQEIVLSQEQTIVCGPKKVLFLSVCYFAMHFEVAETSSDWERHVVRDIFSQWEHFSNFMRIWRRQDVPGFLELLLLTTGHKYPRPHDRIYALCGLFKRYVTSERFAIDYTELVKQFFVRLPTT